MFAAMALKSAMRNVSPLINAAMTPSVSEGRFVKTEAASPSVMSSNAKTTRFAIPRHKVACAKQALAGATGKINVWIRVDAAQIRNAVGEKTAHSPIMLPRCALNLKADRRANEY